MPIQGLVPMWSRLADTAAVDTSDDDQPLLCMQTCMSCIHEVLDLVTEQPDVFPLIEAPLLPLVVRALGANQFESHEDGILVLNYLLHYSPVITPALWSMFPVLVQA